MRVSLIVCSKNGGQRLKNCLAHIDKLEADDDFEVILVDNGSDDGLSYGIADSFRRSSRHPVFLLREQAPGNSAGRNASLGAYSGDIVVFIDDDCYVGVDFIGLWKRAFAIHRPDFASGRILKYDELQSDLGCNDSEEPIVLGRTDFVPRGFIQGSNMAFTRECLTKVERFDERFGAGTRLAGEEWELALRASFAGFRGAYVPGPFVFHDHGRTGRVSDNRLLYYDYGGGAVYAKLLWTSHAFAVARAMLKDMVAIRNPARIAHLLRGFVHFSSVSFRDFLLRPRSRRS